MSYHDQNSKALNYVHAAGFGVKLKDTRLPKDTVSSITGAAGFALADFAVKFNAPVSGLSSGQTAGMNLPGWLFKPDSVEARNKIFAWMPTEQRNSCTLEAKIVFADLIYAAGGKAFKDLGYSPKEEQSDSREDNFIFSGDEQNVYLKICKKGDKPLAIR